MRQDLFQSGKGKCRRYQKLTESTKALGQLFDVKPEDEPKPAIAKQKENGRKKKKKEETLDDLLKTIAGLQNKIVLLEKEQAILARDKSDAEKN